MDELGRDPSRAIAGQLGSRSGSSYGDSGDFGASDFVERQRQRLHSQARSSSSTRQAADTDIYYERRFRERDDSDDEEADEVDDDDIMMEDLDRELDAIEGSGKSKKKKKEKAPKPPPAFGDSKKLQIQARELALRRKQYCDTIVNNDRRRRVKLKKFGEVGYWSVLCSAGKWEKFVGLTTVLSQLYFNSFEFDTKLWQDSCTVFGKMGIENLVHPCGNEPEGGYAVRAEGHNEMRQIRADIGKGCKCRGIEHGKLVHKEIEMYIGFLLAQLDAMSELRRALEGEDPDQCTFRVVRYLDSKGLVPIAAELYVFDEQTGVATALDIVVKDTRNNSRVIAIELKTGYDGVVGSFHSLNGNASTPFMRGCLSHVRDSHKNRFLLQAIVGPMLLVMGEKFERGKDALISKPHQVNVLLVQPGSETVECLGMEEWCEDPELWKQVYKDLVLLNSDRKMMAAMDTLGNSIPLGGIGQKRRLEK